MRVGISVGVCVAVGVSVGVNAGVTVSIGIVALKFIPALQGPYPIALQVRTHQV
jgi:hypothetical protein